jgi:hypothetical protein
MSRLRMFGSRLLGLFRKRGGDENLDAELRSHLDALISWSSLITFCETRLATATSAQTTSIA